VDKIKKISIFALALILLSLAITSLASADREDFDDLDDDDEALFLGLSGLICVIILIPFIIGIIIAIWVYKDAEKRGSSGVLWLLIVFVTGIIGLIIWLVVRPPIGGHPQQQQGTGRMCPNCGRPIPMDAQVCPYCGKNFGQP
jgi:hypothetical protein